MLRRFSIAIVCIVALAIITPAQANPLPVGGSLFNPAIGGAPSTQYTLGLPSWASGSAAATLDATMTLNFQGTSTPYGHAVSKVFFLNGVNATGGLGFTYQFFMSPSFVGTGLVRTSFDTANWLGANITDAGSDSSGSSTAQGSPNWTNGRPDYIERDATSGSMAIQWRDHNNGTILGAGNSSAVVFIAVPNVHSWSLSFTTLLDSGAQGAVNVLAVPAPGAALLGAIGLGITGWIKRRKA